MVTVDLSKCPRIQWAAFCTAILEGMRRFYADPANEAEFEAWLAAQRKEATPCKTNTPD